MTTRLCVESALGKRVHAPLAAFFLLFAMLWPGQARAEPVTFVALAQVKQGGQAGYDDFIKKVKPIWRANGMTVLARLRVVDLMVEPAFPVPTEITVIHAETREGFNAYIGSDAYRQIKQLRLDAVDHLTVLEGNLSGRSGEAFLAKNPMAVVTLSGNASAGERSGLTIDVTLFGPVKGKRSPFLKEVRQVRVMPLGFDDNPTNFAADSDQAFIAEQVR
ncbi:hypothetical protein [Ahrensia sp. R2A130]|uniref:hypothetical protein n=1 Tax=Ahrensia sp. R2A130 TaxID=744979 RepID=UPI0012EA5155|nr:hypothetical protein [Ahrensia sp. R2A130]